jgi:hypothetical protein
MPEQTQNNGANFEIVSEIIALLDPLGPEDREHVYRTVGTWFRIGARPLATVHSPLPDTRTLVSDDEKFSDRPVLSVKDFIFEKDPLTEVERLACLAFYLTHYLDTPHFKTLDLSRLNTEAAQRKLSNPTVAANNAMRDGFFVQAPKAGYKQLSAMGERFVQLLPNREAAQQVKHRMSSRRSRRGGSVRDSKEAAGSSEQPA